MAETWKAVVGFEGRYEVSDEGRIRSLRFRGNGGPKIMKTTPNYAGYHVVTLGRDHKQFRVHCLVLEAFVGPRPAPDIDGCHGDDNKDNNRLGNLRWDTKVNNIAERQSFDGERNPNAKLTNEQVAEIARLRRDRVKCAVIAARFGVTPGRVSQIARANP